MAQVRKKTTKEIRQALDLAEEPTQWDEDTKRKLRSQLMESAEEVMAEEEQSLAESAKHIRNQLVYK